MVTKLSILHGGNMKNFILSLMILTFVGCGVSSSGPDDFTLKYVGRERLEASLKDPSSLEIISEELIRPGCFGGEVGYHATYRAKNSFGDYTVDNFYTE